MGRKIKGKKIQRKVHRKKTNVMVKPTSSLNCLPIEQRKFIPVDITIVGSKHSLQNFTPVDINRVIQEIIQQPLPNKEENFRILGGNLK